MFTALRLTLNRIVDRGSLTITDANGHVHTFGDGSGPPLAIRFTDHETERSLALDPQLTFAEAYMHGQLVIERGTLYDLIELLMRESARRPLPMWSDSLVALRKPLRRLKQLNSAGRAQRNVAHHYDIDRHIYDLFLDSDRQYSCGYFAPGADLEAAQLAKKRHIAAKLDIAPGHRVLDIGSGWGGLGLYLAQACGAHVTGVTLSKEQLAIAEQRARDCGLASNVEFRLEDYRHLDGEFDRIVSVGMFEHVGVNHYAAYFGKIRDLLADDGVALVHTIGRSDGPGYTNPFIEKYIFPGGYMPALSEMLPAIERLGLIVTDVEVLRLHYAETLRAWRERFLANRDEAVAAKGETFARMWEFYLAACEGAFRYQGLVVFQVQMTKRIDALPITRDYIAAAELRLAMREGRRAPEAQRMAGE